MKYSTPEPLWKTSLAELSECLEQGLVHIVQANGLVPSGVDLPLNESFNSLLLVFGLAIESLVLGMKRISD